MTEYVYVLKDSCFADYYLVGSSTDIDQTVNNFKPTLPPLPVCVWQYECTGHAKFTSWILKKYSSKNVRGSWLKLTP